MKEMILLTGILMIWGSMYLVMEKVDHLLKDILDAQSRLGKSDIDKKSGV